MGSGGEGLGQADMEGGGRGRDASSVQKGAPPGELGTVAGDPGHAGPQGLRQAQSWVWGTALTAGGSVSVRVDGPERMQLVKRHSIPGSLARGPLQVGAFPSLSFRRRVLGREAGRPSRRP